MPSDQAKSGRLLGVGGLYLLLRSASVYHYNLARFIAGPHSLPPSNLIELQAAFKRVLQAGLANLPEEGFDEESLDVDRPGSPDETITTLQYDDPRAVDFRNYLRTWYA
ncbi:hypothetical protein AcV5_001226 [Taiwanofungus camphoratus]|nr:hypothetical protein AcV5_001226 [Antrodia cinnamomea]